MFHLDNNSGISSMPVPAAAQNTTPRWFTEGAGSVPPSWPGQDWYNIVQAELLAVLAAAGIVPDKSKLNQLALAIKAISNKDALLKANLLSEIKTAGASAQKTSRGNLGLGTAATSNVQTSQTDSTGDAVLLNGAWGLGAVVIPIPDNADIYTYFLTAKTGFYRIGQLVTNGVFKGADFIWALHSLSSVTGKAAYGNLYELSTDGMGSAIHTLKAGEWSVSRNYSDKYKPTAGDVGALPANGNAVSATKLATARKIAGKAFDGTADIVITAGDVDALPIGGGTLTGNLGVKYQLQVGSVGSGVLNIGDANSGLRSSIKGQVDLFANGRMYGYWNATELAFAGQIIPTDYANFDAKYQPKGNYALVGASYTKVESDYRYYTKAVSDAAYAPASWSYSKAASDARYVTNVRLGPRATTASNPQFFEVPIGCVITGFDVAGDSNASVTAYYRPVQMLINGNWITAINA